MRVGSLTGQSIQANFMSDRPKNILSKIAAYSRQFLWRWWLLIIPLIITVLVTYYFTSRLPRIYETSSTYVIRPRSEIVLAEDFVRALDTVSRRIEINTTFAEVAKSDLVKDAAIAQLGLTKEERQNLSASASVLAGTNILEITARGRKPELVRDFTTAVGEETVNYVSNLYDVFELEPLDSASTPLEPTSPKMAVNLLLAAVIGSLLGVGLVYASRYFKKPGVEFDEVNIIDTETGAYTKSYFNNRLHQEMSRVSRSSTPISISLVKIKFVDWPMDEVTNDEWVQEMKSLKPFIEPYLKDEDVLARYDVDTFGLLLPDSGEETSLKLMNKLRVELNTLTAEHNNNQRKHKIRGSIGLVTYVSNKLVTSEDELIGFANFGVKNADKSSSGGITRYVINGEGGINEIEEP